MELKNEDNGGKMRIIDNDDIQRRKNLHLQMEENKFRAVGMEKHYHEKHIPAENELRIDVI